MQLSPPASPNKQQLIGTVFALSLTSWLHHLATLSNAFILDLAGQAYMLLGNRLSISFLAETLGSPRVSLWLSSLGFQGRCPPQEMPSTCSPSVMPGWWEVLLSVCWDGSSQKTFKEAAAPVSFTGDSQHLLFSALGLSCQLWENKFPLSN